MESRIWLNFGCGIQNPWAMESRTAQGIWNPATDWNLEPTLHWQRIQNPQHGIQNPRLLWISNMRWVGVSSTVHECPFLSTIAWTNHLLGEGQAYFCDAVIDHFRCLQIVMYWKTVLWIMIEVHSVKPELPKSLIVYTYTEDQSKKINR